jgi:hypothetical protein
MRACACAPAHPGANLLLFTELGLSNLAHCSGVAPLASHTSFGARLYHAKGPAAPHPANRPGMIRRPLARTGADQRSQGRAYTQRHDPITQPSHISPTRRRIDESRATHLRRALPRGCVIRLFAPGLFASPTLWQTALELAQAWPRQRSASPRSDAVVCSAAYTTSVWGIFLRPVRSPVPTPRHLHSRSPAGRSAPGPPSPRAHYGDDEDARQARPQSAAVGDDSRWVSPPPLRSRRENPRGGFLASTRPWRRQRGPRSSHLVRWRAI